MPKPKHGGKRPGAGRPTRDGAKRVPLNARIAAETSERLNAYAQKHGLGIGQAIDAIVEELKR